MIFAVDNTTEKIITQLQDAVEGSIRKVHEDHAELSQEIHSLKHEISQEEVLDAIREVRKDFEEMGDRIGDIERSNEDSLTALDGIKSGIKKLEENPVEEDIKQLQDKLDALSKNLSEIKNGIAGIQKQSASIGNNITTIQKDVAEIKETQSNILKYEENIEKQLESILTSEAESKAALADIQEKTSQNGTQIEKVAESVVTSGGQIKMEIRESIESNGSRVREELTETIHSSNQQTESTLKEAMDSSNSQIKEAIEGQGSQTEQRILDNREELLKIKESLATSDLKLDQLASDNEKIQKYDSLEAEKIDKIMEYLKKPGIARFFSGLKGE